jgi:oxygen-independent coproporphyrinogen-3 oxidase
VTDLAASSELAEPAFGSYFVSAYPPFSSWSEDQVGCVADVLDDPAPAGAPFGLYVHVPFCVQRCQYCYYLAHDDRPEVKERYLDALLAELRLYARRPAFANRELSFVYFGGGTPSSLTTHQLERLFAGLRREYPWEHVEEVTFECAPKTVTESKVRVLRDAGVNRISLGVQQMDDRVLAANGRVHLVADVERAYEHLSGAGFDVVNLDLMVGLVGETEDTFMGSLERVITMAPESVTIYQLEIPFNTPLYRQLRDDDQAEQPASWSLKRARLARGFARLGAAGYTLRSAYTAVREPERHLFRYQDLQYAGADLLGIGVSAFSYLGGTHFQNITRLEPHLERVEAACLPLARAHVLSDHERLVRELVLQLKLLCVPLAPLRAKFGLDPLEVFADPLRRLVAGGWIRTTDDTIELTPRGVPCVDRLVREFFDSPRHPHGQDG